MPHDIEGARAALLTAQDMAAAAEEALVTHFESFPAGGPDSRTRHLQAEIDGARRRVGLCQARLAAMERLNLAESAQAETAQRETEDAAAAQYRAQCLEVLQDRRHRAADAMVEWLAVEMGSGVASPAFSGSVSGWVGQLARTTGVDVGNEALALMRARSLGA